MLLQSTLITSGFIDMVMVIQHLFCIEILISTILMIQMENQCLFNVGLLSGMCCYMSPLRFTVECRSSADGSDSVTLEVVNPTLVRPVQTTEPPLVIQTEIATDASFTEFLPELHRPLSSLQGRPLHLEVRALGTGSRLLVHYCLAYIQTPHPAWMLLYHGCWSQTPLGLSQPTLSALRITVPHFLASPPSSQTLRCSSCATARCVLMLPTAHFTVDQLYRNKTLSSVITPFPRGSQQPPWLLPVEGEPKEREKEEWGVRETVG
ncbi:unnamed protein product [Arctogadus glacialis]